MTTYAYAFASVFAVSLISFVGLFTLSLNERLLKKYVLILVALAVGALLGDAFIHLIPESFELAENGPFVSGLIIGGIVLFFLIEKLLHWHHHYAHGGSGDGTHPTGKLVILSDGLHNVLDGLIIGASYMVSVELGVASTIAIVLHEIPQEIGDFGVLIHSGYSRARALWYNFLSALTAFIGLAAALAVSGSAAVLEMWILPVAAGGFIYIAMGDLIPELQKEKGGWSTLAQLTAVTAGIAAMFLLLGLD